MRLVGWLGWLFKETDPTNPLSGTRVKIFEFDQNRVSNTAPTIGQFHPREKPGSPYIYIDSANYSTASVGTCDAASPVLTQTHFKSCVLGSTKNGTLMTTFQIFGKARVEISRRVKRVHHELQTQKQSRLYAC
jgi:hypothetical protein